MRHDTDHRQSDSNRLVPLLLFVVVSSVYFATVSGITDGNAGSHYAAARALAGSGHLDIAGFESFTNFSDYAIGIDGALHSDRPPGTALLAAATYRVGLLAPEPPVGIRSVHDGGNPYVIHAVLAAVLSGSLAVLLFYAILRQHFETSQAAALLASLGLAFATTHWKYSTTLYTHAPAAMFSLLAVYLGLGAARQHALRWPAACLLGFSLGASVLMEYTHAVFVVLSLLYLGVALGRPLATGLRDVETRRAWLVTSGALALGGAIPALFLFAYNKALFGGFFQLSAYWVDPVLWACCTTFAGNFSTPVLSGLWGNLFYGNDNQGIFLLMPIAALAVLGWRGAFRHSRRDFVYILGSFAVMLLIFSTVTTVNPDTDDSRYITPFLGLWLLPLGVWLDRYALRRRTDLARLGVSVLFYGLLFLSIRSVFMHIAFSWGYGLRLDALPAMSTPPQTIATLLATVFPNAGNLPLLWLLEAIALAVVWAGRALARRLPDRIVRWIGVALAALALIVGAMLGARALSSPVPPPGMTPLDAAFSAPQGGAIRLRGYRVAEWYGDPTPGDPLYLRLYWEAEGLVGRDYSVVVWLETEGGEVWAETRAPLGRATWRERPPDTWQAGRVFQEQYAVTPPDVPNEDMLMAVWLALETPEGERLPAGETGTNALRVLTVRPADWQPVER